MNAPLAPVRSPRVALVGNPNAGKSTLFNALTGAQAHVSNWTGTTVERLEAQFDLPGLGRATAIDLPGTYSLAARSPEEAIAIEHLLGWKGEPPDVVVAVVDGPRLERSLYLVLQLLELRVPVVVGVNLMDEAESVGRRPRVDALAEVLGVPVVGLVARSGEGIDALRTEVARVLKDPSIATPGSPVGFGEALVEDAQLVADAFGPELRALAGADDTRVRALAMWLLLSLDPDAPLARDPRLPGARVAEVRAAAKASGRDLEAEIIGQRYAWIDARAAVVLEHTPRGRPLSDSIDRVLLNPVSGLVVFLAVMAVVFQALFAWSDPAIGFIEDAFAALGGAVAGGFDAVIASVGLAGPLGFLRDLVVEGIIEGVGAILVFLPQIGLLFLFIALLEDCGYLSRAAHLMDRILRAAGLPGRAFVPLLSGFACAVPAVLSTRTMPRARDRLLTMMVVPLTSCSARLPVYTLIIAAVFPPAIAGWPLDLRPTVLFGMYALSTVTTLLAAVVLGRFVLHEEPTPEFIELPPYRLPHMRTVARTVWARMLDFVQEAGRVILVATVILWALLSFPKYDAADLVSADVRASEPAEVVEHLEATRALERSYGGRLGKVIEPAIAPLGYDWRIGVGIIGSFAAREVFVSTMGVVHGIGEVDEEDVGLREAVRDAKRSDGSRLYTPLTGLSLMVFFAFAFQCLSTLAVLRRETNGWRWPLFIVAYMSALAWTSAFIVYQGGHALGFH